MPKNELKEKILNEIATGATAQECSDKYGIPAGTIRSWLFRLKNGGVAEKKPATKNATQRKPATQHKDVAAKNKAAAKEKEPVVKLEDVDEELTEKQRLFCFYYIRNFNATQAAIKAGYSSNCAGQIGYELLTKPYIRAEIDRLKKLKAYSLMLTPEDIVERYMQMAFADITDIAEWDVKETPPDIDANACAQIVKGKRLKAYKYNTSVVIKASKQIDGGLIKEISQTEHGIKIKLEDRRSALEWLANYMGMNPKDKHREAYDRAVLELRERELKLKEF
jgi:phage terminase small subunit